MFSDLVLVHRKDGDAFRAASSDWRLWQTCLRKVAFGPAHALSELELRPEDQIHAGSEAYRVCLEIICGLHSPLVGETEVFGQFKNAVAGWFGAWPGGPDASGLERDLRRFTRALLEDAKKIRATHLNDLGSQSYGSLLRKELRGAPVVHVVGGGHLAGEILPWICKDGTNVHVHVRDLARAGKLRAQFPGVRFHGLSGRLSGGAAQGSALVVAAPMSAADLAAWAGGGVFDRVFDLRGGGDADRLSSLAGDGPLTPLHELMRRISANQESIAGRRKLAFDAIANVVAERDRHVEYRPFGWEDVCA